MRYKYSATGQPLHALKLLTHHRTVFEVFDFMDVALGRADVGMVQGILYVFYLSTILDRHGGESRPR